MASRKKSEASSIVASRPDPNNLDPRTVSRALSRLRREAPGWNAPIVGFIAMQSRDPFKTLISCILSLRTKDQTTLVASERLFARADTPAKMLRLSARTLERLIYPVGFYRTKARAIRGICRDLIDKFHGSVPDEIDLLMTLKGVGRKTANLVVTDGDIFNEKSKVKHVFVDGRWFVIHEETPPEKPGEKKSADDDDGTRLKQSRQVEGAGR